MYKVGAVFNRPLPLRANSSLGVAMKGIVESRALLAKVNALSLDASPRDRIERALSKRPLSRADYFDFAGAGFFGSAGAGFGAAGAPGAAPGAGGGTTPGAAPGRAGWAISL